MLMKWKFKISKFIYLSALVITPLTQGCSLSSYATGEGLFGTLAGAAAGAGIGELIGDKYGKKSENLALGAGVGAASGLMLGALIHDTRAETAKEKALIVRQAQYVNSRQRDIDNLRLSVDKESSWGRLDDKPWSERYQIETSELPYQGLGLE